MMKDTRGRDIPQREVIAVLGKTGFGKSWWAKLWAQYLRRLMLYDPMQSEEYLIEEWTDDPADSEDSFRGDTYRVGIVDPEGVPALGSFAFAYGHTSLVLEEMSTVFEKGTARLPEWAKRLIFMGRHRSVNMVFLAQRAASIPIDLRSQCSRIVSFQQHEADDMNWLEDFYGPELTETIAGLPKFTCLDYHNGETVSYSITPEVARRFGVRLTDAAASGLSVGGI